MLAAGRQVDALVTLCIRHAPQHAVIADPTLFAALRDGLADAGLRTQAHAGDEALQQLVAGDACDTVVAAIVGAVGLPSTLAAARAGKRLLLANKESLVLAGELLTAIARDAGATIIPIDSEHNAIFQCLPPTREPDGTHAGLRRILLTASGGPFRGHAREQLLRSHAGAGNRASQMVDGAEDFGRFRDADEQGPRGHRSAPPVRPAR